MRDKKAIESYINLSMSAVNLLRVQEMQGSRTDVCSLASAKRRNYNQTLINRLFSQVGLDPTCPKLLPHVTQVRAFGALVV